MFLRVSSAIAGLCLACLSVAQVKSPTVITDLVMVGRSPAIHAMVDGHQALLELDTGSFELRLSSDFVDKWHVDERHVALKIGTAPTMKLKALVEDLAGPAKPAVSGSYRPKSDGIVGLDVLRHFALGLDNANGQVALWYGGNVGQDTADAWARGSAGGIKATTSPQAMSKIELLSHGPDDWYRVKGTVNGRPLDLLLDTGTAYSTVNPSLEKPLGLRVIGSTPVQEIGHLESLKVAMADSIGFGPYLAEFPVLNIESSEDPEVQGILGTEALGTGKFVIDMPGLAFYATRMKARRGNPLERRLRDAGLDLFPSENSVLLILVRPGSAAEKIGAASGDRLMAVGDVTVEDLFGAGAADGDSDRMRKLMRVGLKAISGDLSVTVKRKDGKSIDIPLPK